MSRSSSSTPTFNFIPSLIWMPSGAREAADEAYPPAPLAF
jgi:hypothetical protein